MNISHVYLIECNKYHRFLNELHRLLMEFETFVRSQSDSELLSLVLKGHASEYIQLSTIKNFPDLNVWKSVGFNFKKPDQTQQPIHIHYSHSDIDAVLVYDMTDKTCRLILPPHKARAYIKHLTDIARSKILAIEVQQNFPNHGEPK